MWLIGLMTLVWSLPGLVGLAVSPIGTTPPRAPSGPQAAATTTGATPSAATASGAGERVALDAPDAAEARGMTESGGPPFAAFVDVSVATLWVEPGAARPEDAPALGNPAEPRRWVEGMSVDQKRDLVGRLETQALYGQRVVVDEVRDGWSHVWTSNQWTPRDTKGVGEGGYPGWVPSVQLTRQAPEATGREARVTGWTAQAFRDASRVGAGAGDLELSFNTRLPVRSLGDGWVEVNTTRPGQSLYLDRRDVAVTASGERPPTPTGDQVVATAAFFTGLPYLWAGTSGFGFDCSGFTHEIYAAWGIILPRDADAQANAAGTWISDRDRLQPGDLVFFAYEEGKGDIHHVAIYTGNGNVIDSPRTGEAVQTGPLRTHRYANEFVGARRILDGVGR